MVCISCVAVRFSDAHVPSANVRRGVATNKRAILGSRKADSGVYGCDWFRWPVSGPFFASGPFMQTLRTHNGNTRVTDGHRAVLCSVHRGLHCLTEGCGRMDISAGGTTPSVARLPGSETTGRRDQLSTLGRFHSQGRNFLDFHQDLDAVAHLDVYSVANLSQDLG